MTAKNQMELAMREWLPPAVHIDQLKMPEGGQVLIMKCPDCRQLRLMLNPYPVRKCGDFIALEALCDACWCDMRVH